MTTLDSNAVARVMGEMRTKWRAYADALLVTSADPPRAKAAVAAIDFCLADLEKLEALTLPPVGLSGEETPDCESNADYIEFCGQKLVGLGYRIAGTTLSAIAAEHRRLASQSSQAPGAVGEAVVFTVWTKANGLSGWMTHDGDTMVREGKHGDLGKNRAVHLFAHPPTSPEVTEAVNNVPHRGGGK